MLIASAEGIFELFTCTGCGQVIEVMVIPPGFLDAADFQCSSCLTQNDAFRWVSAASVWDKITAIAEVLNRLSAEADNTRMWNPQHNLLGIAGEWVYGEVSGQPIDLDAKARRVDLRDGGEDFPGVDVKATSRKPPLLLRLRTDPLRALHYALVLIEVAQRRGRYVGYATKSMLDHAPDREYGYGPTRTLEATELVKALPGIAR